MGGPRSGRKKGSNATNTFRSHLASALDVLSRTGESFVTRENKTRVHSYASKMGIKVKTARHMMVYERKSVTDVLVVERS